MASPSLDEEPMADAFHHQPSQQTPAAHEDAQEPPLLLPDDGDDGDVFEFAFVIKGPETGQQITADEIFSNGFIRPVYPAVDGDLLHAAAAAAPPSEKEKKTAPARVTLLRLFNEEREENSGSASASASSEVDELAGIPSGTYCPWEPRSPTRCRKSSSMGTALRWRGSHSDGKENLVFLSAEQKKSKVKESTTSIHETAEGPTAAAVAAAAAKEEKEKREGKGRGRQVAMADVVTARQIYYPNDGEGGAAGRSFLPQKEDLIGFFANMNRLTWTHNPF